MNTTYNHVSLIPVLQNDGDPFVCLLRMKSQGLLKTRLQLIGRSSVPETDMPLRSHLAQTVDRQLGTYLAGIVAGHDCLSRSTFRTSESEESIAFHFDFEHASDMENLARIGDEGIDSVVMLRLSELQNAKEDSIESDVFIAGYGWMYRRTWEECLAVAKYYARKYHEQQIAALDAQGSSLEVVTTV